MKISISKSDKVPRIQSGVVPCRVKEDGSIEVMLIRTSSNKNWGVPKGGLEPNISLEQNAAKEAEEEAGVQGVVHEKLDTVQYVKGKTGRPQILTLYAMSVTDVLRKYDEAGDRARRWFDSDKAINKVEPMYRKAVKKAVKRAFKRSAQAQRRVA